MVTCRNCRSENPDGARFCGSCGSALEAPRPVEGERKFATVLFADVVRSTAIAEKLDPEDWAAIMNGAFGFMNGAVRRYEGTVARLMGDAVLALFGAPTAHEDDAERAVRAGLEIRDDAAAYAATVRQRYGARYPDVPLDFSVRVGINTGTVVLAMVGDAVKAEYTAMGDAANVAARLQSTAAPGTVRISAATHKLVHAAFETRSLGPLSFAGKSEPLETFEVVSAKASPGTGRGLQGLASPLVGRDAELALLRQRVESLRSGAGSVVAVVGEAGLGKSRLIAELRQALDALPEHEVAWFEGRALSYGQAQPYHVWQQLGRRMIGAVETDGAAAVREKLGAFAARFALSDADRPLLETMLAVDTEQSRAALAGIEGQALVFGVANAVVSCLYAAIQAGGRPVPHVLIFEDLHWADGPSLELVAQAASLAAGTPLMVIAALRPDRRAPSWALLDRLRTSTPHAFAQLDLEPLPPAVASTLLGNLLRIEDLPEHIRALILERAEGNPFFLEEVLRSLIDSGAVVQQDDHWRATRVIESVEIPQTLAGVLSARLDRLPDATKRVAQTAAVIGRVFAHRALSSVCRMGAPAERIDNVDPHLGTLSYEELVRERARQPEREYAFKHALTCDAAYGLLLNQRRRELHARAGAVLEELYADRVDEVAPVLAHHFAEAEDRLRTGRYATRAAGIAMKLFALREAVAQYEQALKAYEAMPEPPADLFADAVFGWVGARQKLDDQEGVVPRLERVIQLTRAAGDKARLARALSWLGNAHMLRGFPSLAVPFLMESEELAGELGDDQLLLLPLFYSSQTLVDTEPARAVEVFQTIVNAAREQHMPEIVGHALAYRAVALARIGAFDAADAAIHEALEAAPLGGSRIKEADVHIGVAMAYYDMGDIKHGLEHARIGADMAHAANGMECACFGYFGVGVGEYNRGQVEASLAEYDRSLGIGLRFGAGWEPFFNRVRGGVAVSQLAQGDAEKVCDLESALANARQVGDRQGAAELSEELAHALLRLDRLQDAETQLVAALAHYRATGMKAYVARALAPLATLRERQGRGDDARRIRDEEAALRASFRSRSSAMIEAAVR
jgi:class 3 adenylate cyclase/tetratricopeptide (TPR) repeat protein